MAILLVAAIAAPAFAQGLPTWVFAPPAKNDLTSLWSESISARSERVACLGGTISGDTVKVDSVRILEVTVADSLTADAHPSLAVCIPPAWMGTAHTHVRSTDDPAPAPRFSPGDRAVMSTWSERWSRQGAWCVLYSDKNAHCEVYPPHRSEPALPPDSVKSPG
ncbi:MAG: hypothetical protein ABJD11_09380 [Gemmatimonadota bacterium]